jgi:GNAT superfamily N-acetyltransferase
VSERSADHNHDLSFPITVAVPEELPAITDIVRKATHAMIASGIDQWDEHYPHADRLAADIESGTLHVIRCDRRPAGLVVLNGEQEPEYETVCWTVAGRPMIVHRLTVDPAYQRRGLATRLMRYAEAYAAGRYDTIRLDAFLSNPAAVALYERLGYRRAGTVEFRKGTFVCFEKPVGLRVP